MLTDFCYSFALNLLVLLRYLNILTTFYIFILTIIRTINYYLATETARQNRIPNYLVEEKTKEKRKRVSYNCN